jgi:hypothetical protein
MGVVLLGRYLIIFLEVLGGGCKRMFLAENQEVLAAVAEEGLLLPQGQAAVRLVIKVRMEDMVLVAEEEGLR